jgi:putative RNA 2'-phosphotransferase
VAYSKTETSKFLSFVLRHKPESIGLTLDPEGWAEIRALIEKATVAIDLNHLHEVVRDSDKRRFLISSDGLYIRANQGHSIPANLDLKPIRPPEFLYHGTATRFLPNIQNEGIKPQTRQYVHLSKDTETATKVGQRHGKLAILKIASLLMHDEGFDFFQSLNGVWLTKSVPKNYLTRVNLS